MRLLPDPPGAALERGRYTALVARPELDRFRTLYLYAAVPPPRAAAPGTARRRGRPAQRMLVEAGGG